MDPNIEAQCTKCDTVKPLTDFYGSKRKTNGHQSECKVCQLAQAAAYRASAKGSTAVARSNANRRIAAKEWLWSLKSGPCTDCGGRFHPASMQFDHLPGSEKKFHITVAEATRNRERFLEEIAKCELVCANCHAVRTWRRKQKD